MLTAASSPRFGEVITQSKARLRKTASDAQCARTPEQAANLTMVVAGDSWTIEKSDK